MKYFPSIYNHLSYRTARFVTANGFRLKGGYLIKLSNAAPVFMAEYRTHKI